MSFKGKVVIVTGAGSGNGAGFALLFAKEGADLAIVGRTESKLIATANKCEQFGRKPLVIPADVSKENDARDIIEKTVEHFGRIDVLVNNAALFKLGSLLDGNILNAYDETLATNLRGPVYLTSLAAPHLIKTKGNVVNISSVASVITTISPDHVAYHVAKAGLNHFTKCAALELAPSGVRVNATMCGAVYTDFLTNGGFEGEAANWDNLKPMTALNRVSQPEEIAEVVLFLASDKAKSVTGSIFVCDNGFLIKSS